MSQPASVHGSTSINWSRLILAGTITLESPLRVGAGEGMIALDSSGVPYLPGSTLRGALRTYIESALRGMTRPNWRGQYTVTLRGLDGRPATVSRMVALSCDSVDKRDDDINYQGCLTGAIVKKWEADPVLRPNFEAALIGCTCYVCRLFGANWLAGKTFIPDAVVVASSWRGNLLDRGGLTLHRDRDTMLPGSDYWCEAVPSGVQFSFRLIAENTTPAEQGMLLLGLHSTSAGLIALGADRGRGFGRVRLALDWSACRSFDPERLIANLRGTDQGAFTAADADEQLTALAAFIEGKSLTGAMNAPRHT